MNSFIQPSRIGSLPGGEKYGVEMSCNRLKGGMENGNNTRHFGTSMDRTNNTDAGVELNLVSLNN